MGLHSSNIFGGPNLQVWDSARLSSLLLSISQKKHVAPYSSQATLLTVQVQDNDSMHANLMKNPNKNSPGVSLSLQFFNFCQLHQIGIFIWPCQYIGIFYCKAWKYERLTCSFPVIPLLYAAATDMINSPLWTVGTNFHSFNRHLYIISIRVGVNTPCNTR